MWVLAVREDCSQSSSSSSYIKDTTGVVIEDGFFFWFNPLFVPGDIWFKVALATFCQSSFTFPSFSFFFFLNLHTMTPSHIPERNPWLSEGKLSHSAVLVLCQSKKNTFHVDLLSGCGHKNVCLTCSRESNWNMRTTVVPPELIAVTFTLHTETFTTVKPPVFSAF